MKFTITTLLLPSLVSACSVISPATKYGATSIPFDPDFIVVEDDAISKGKPTPGMPSHVGRRASLQSRNLLGEDGTYNPDADAKPWILSDIYFLDKSLPKEELIIPDFMTGWLTFQDEWPINGYRDESEPNTNYRTQKNPHYGSKDDLSPHQIPVNIVTLTNRTDLKFGTKMNPYISNRNGLEYGERCSQTSGTQSRYENGDIGYFMFDACHGLLYVEDMTLAVNSFLQKKSQAVEFVLMEFSIHRHDECWAPMDVGGCRTAMMADSDFAKEGMINIFVVDSEEVR